MTWLWSSTFLPYTINSVTSELTGYEAAKLAVMDNHPYLRSWRSNNSLAQQTIICDVGAPIVDPGIELGTLTPNWSTVIGTPGGGDAATADGSVKRTGNFSLKVVCASGNVFGRTQLNISVVPGVTYRLTGYVSVTARTGGNIQLVVSTTTPGLNLLALTLSATTAGFQAQSGTFTVPAGQTLVNIAFYGDTTPHFTAYLDDVSLVPQIGTVAVFNTNIDNIQLAAGPDTIAGNFVALAASPITPAKWWAYYRFCSVQSVVIEKEFFRVRTGSSASSLDSAAYFEIGSLCFLPTLTAFPRAPAVDMRETLTRDYEKSAESVAPAGPFRIQQEWSMVAEAAQVQGLRDFALIGENTTFLVYENNGLNQECYLFRTTDNMQFTRAGKNKHQIVNPRILELV